MSERLRALPSVDRLAAEALDGEPQTQAQAISAARRVLDERRAQLLAGAEDDPDLVERVRAALAPSLRRVLNGTGVVVHTNLGRSPLPRAAVEAVAAAAEGYANLELDLENGRRGNRDEHVRALLCELTGAQDALVVNNGAGAVLLAVAALGAGRGVVVSRGQLVEIGGGFRIPDVVAQAGLEMVEVGTTNRTRRADYERALERCGDGLVLRVHRSNFRTEGFVADVEIEELCALGAPVVDDLGSGALAEGVAVFDDEPPVRRSVAAGATLVCFSADKLLGGPQAGILVGHADAVSLARRHPLSRALRIGRLPLAALAATLALYRDPQRALREIPTLAMLTVEPEALADRTARLADACGASVVEAVGRVGGGALPLAELRGPVVRLDGPAEELARALRMGDPPLVARIADGHVIVDPRTLAEEEMEPAAQAILAALERVGEGVRAQSGQAAG